MPLQRKIIKQLSDKIEKHPDGKYAFTGIVPLTVMGAVGSSSNQRIRPIFVSLTEVINSSYTSPFLPILRAHIVDGL